MSSYTQKLKHPKTGKMQIALCLDDYYGSHGYGYGFHKDGTDYDMENNPKLLEDLEFFREEELAKEVFKDEPVVEEKKIEIKHWSGSILYTSKKTK